jgi:hypothetical protein
MRVRIRRFKKDSAPESKVLSSRLGRNPKLDSEKLRVKDRGQYLCDRLLDYTVNDRGDPQLPLSAAVGFWDLNPPDSRWPILAIK